MYKNDEDVLPGREALRQYKLGLITYEELEEIRKINIKKSKRKYARSEKGIQTRKNAYKTFEEKENYLELRSVYNKRFYNNHREEIIENKKAYQKEYIKKKKERQMQE